MCPGEKGKSNGNWKTPTIMKYPQLCNTTLENIMGGKGRSLFLWKSGGEESLE